MAATRYDTVNNIVNAVAVEVGLGAVPDVMSSTDPAFITLVTLLNTCGRRLGEMHEWQMQVREFQQTTSSSDDGKYPLPTDFNYMIEQTGWERANDTPVYGPLSAQDWTFLLGRNLGGTTLYVSFRLDQNEIWVHPNNPVINALNINFEYISTYWAAPTTWDPADITTANKDKVDSLDDIVLYPITLITRYLKLAFKDAKGFDTVTSMADFRDTLDSRSTKDKGAPILNTGRTGTSYPFLTVLRNVPDTGLGT